MKRKDKIRGINEGEVMKGKDKMTQEELEEIIKRHQHWLKRDCDGWEQMRADFSYKHLQGFSIIDTDLPQANFSFSIIENMTFDHADLINANLYCANILNTSFDNSLLQSSYFEHSRFKNASLNNSNCTYADFSCAIVRDTIFYNTDLYGVSFEGTIFERSPLKNVINVPFIPLSCPEYGSFIGFKKAIFEGKEYIVVLEIPSDAKRSSATSRKCRTNKAKVIEIQNMDGSKSDTTMVRSYYNNSFLYELGKTIEVEDFDDNRWNECSTGIHFFINREEAVRY